ncbi:hypothetical protein HZ326_17880 [Fusarium oxysporum f. sp. albedinis]|nr:hypothetical protein HZ326_17880 [Fusarium oxysporum f. sp. albedinis]
MIDVTGVGCQPTLTRLANCIGPLLLHCQEVIWPSVTGIVGSVTTSESPLLYVFARCVSDMYFIFGCWQLHGLTMLSKFCIAD